MNSLNRIFPSLIMILFLAIQLNANEINPTKQKLKEIIIDHIKLEEVNLPAAIKFLQKRSRELDPAKKGVNIILKLDKSDDNKTKIPITMQVDNIPVGEAIQYICKANNLNYRIDKHAVVVASRNIKLSRFETRIYPIEQEAVSAIGGDEEEDVVRKYFMRRGVKFSEGASIVYDSRISRLIATNTPENLDIVEQIIMEINVIDPQIWLELKTVRLPEKDYRKLKRIKPFSWKNVVNSDKAEIIAMSSVFTLNGQEAVVRMISEKHFPESWGGSITKDDKTGLISKEHAGPSFGECTEIGPVFRVTPNVDFDDYAVSLDLNPVVNAQAGWTEFGTGSVKMPELEATSTETTITTDDGETVLLSSKISTISNPNRNKYQNFRVATFLTVRLMNPDGMPVRKIKNDLWVRERKINSSKKFYTRIKNEDEIYLTDELKQILKKKVNVNFNETNFSDVRLWLKKHFAMSVDLKTDRTNESTRISLSLIDAPLGDVLKYACWLSGLYYHINPECIIISDEIDEMRIMFFKIRSALISCALGEENAKKLEQESVNATNEALKKYFSDRGVPFPDGASISFDRKTSKLRVKNTRENLRSMESLMRDLDIQTPLVKGEVLFVEIPEKDLRELLGVKVPVDVIPPSFFDKIIDSDKARIISGAEIISSSGSTAVFRDVKELFAPESYAMAELVIDNGQGVFCPPVPELRDPRDLGFRFEYTPTASPDNYTINLNLHPQFVKLTGWTKYSYDFKSGVESGKSWPCEYKMPEFGRCDAITNVKVYDGKTLLIARTQAATPTGDEKFPFFDDKLFSRQLNGEVIPQNEITVKNLFIFVTAKLVGNDGKPIRP